MAEHFSAPLILRHGLQSRQPQASPSLAALLTPVPARDRHHRFITRKTSL